MTSCCWPRRYAPGLRTDPGRHRSQRRQPRCGRLGRSGPKVDQRYGTAAALAVRKARNEIAYLLPAVDSDRVSGYLRHLAGAEVVSGLGFTLESDDVTEIADQVVQNDDVADALARLLDADRDAYRPSPLTLHISATTTRPDLVALEAVSYAEDTDLMAAWCSTPTKWALVLWRRPDFVVVSGAATGPPKWQHFKGDAEGGRAGGTITLRHRSHFQFGRQGRPHAVDQTGA